MQQPRQDYEEEEIDLREYLNIIIKRKGIIITVFILSVITALIVSFLMPKIFEAHAIIRLGHTALLPVSKPDAIEELRGQKSFESALRKLSIDSDKFDKDKILRIDDMGGSDFIKITVKTSNPALAADICNTLAGDFVTAQQETLNKYITFLKEQSNEFEKRYQIVLKEMDDFNKIILESKDYPNYPFFTTL